MADLLDAVSVHAANGGALWALKGQAGMVDDAFIRASLHRERESHHPFGAADHRSASTPERVDHPLVLGAVGRLARTRREASWSAPA